MNDPLATDGLSNVPWPTHGHHVRVADTSMLPGSERPRPAAVGLLRKAVDGMHQSIDRLAGEAAPAMRQLGTGVGTAVHDSPLMVLAAAFVLGVLVARGRR